MKPCIINWLVVFNALIIIFSGCTIVSDAPLLENTAMFGSPATHGFVVVEGEFSVRRPQDEESQWEIIEIQEVTLEKVGEPFYTLRGRAQSGLTWFSDLQPGDYLIKEIKLRKIKAGEKAKKDEHRKGLLKREFDYPRQFDALVNSQLRFSIKAGQLLYLGLIEIDDPGFANNFLRINIIKNHNEAQVWETVYELYQETPWKSLILDKLAHVIEEKQSVP